MNPFLQLGIGIYAPQLMGGGFGAHALTNMVTGWGNADLFKNSFSESKPTMARLDNNMSNNTMNELNTNLNKTAGRKCMEKISSADLKFVDDMIKNAPKMTKTAAPGGGGGLLRGMLGSPLMREAMPWVNALALGTIGVSAGSALYDKAKDAVKKHLSYNAMFEEFPELNEMPRTQVDKYWNVLNDFAPKLTTNPLVAGQFISNMASYGMRGVDHNVIGQLAKIQGDLRNSSGIGGTIGMLNDLGVEGFKQGYQGMMNVDPSGVPAISDGGATL